MNAQTTGNKKVKELIGLFGMEEHLAPLDLLNRAIFEKTANRFKVGTLQGEANFRAYPYPENLFDQPW